MPLQASLTCHLCSNRNLTPVVIPQGLPVDAALQRGLKVGIQPRIKPMHDSKLTRCLQDACLAFMGQEAASGLQVLHPSTPPPSPRECSHKLEVSDFCCSGWCMSSAASTSRSSCSLGFRFGPRFSVCCFDCVTMVQSEISRAYVSEMENELEKNPRGAAQAVRTP
jgi:hypothetical protein